MENIVKSLLLGLAAGIINVIPMALLGLDWRIYAATSIHWVGLGVIITFARMDLKAWQSGMIIGGITGIPIALFSSCDERTPWVVTLLLSFLLGGLLGLMAEKLIHSQPK